jgi:cystathionine gamma-synthase
LRKPLPLDEGSCDVVYASHVLEHFSRGEARAFLKATRLFSLAGSLGSVDSLVNHPATMTHSALQGTSLEVSPSVVRLSVGIESTEDLLADVDQALSVATR